MPYKDKTRGGWRGQVFRHGKRYSALFETKKEASEWEIQKRKELTSPSLETPKGMALLEFCTRYLNFAERYVFKTFDEKRTLCRRIVRVWGEETSVDDITPDIILDYLER